MRHKKGFAVVWIFVAIAALAAAVWGAAYLEHKPATPAGQSATTTVNDTTTTTTTSGSDQGILPYQSGISGTITTGPSCPVEHNPPQAGCEPKPYAYALVAIFRASDPVHAVVLTKADASGTFKASLPPGDYVVGAGDSNLPRCPHTPAAVGPLGYVQLAISCDTGIR